MKPQNSPPAPTFENRIKAFLSPIVIATAVLGIFSAFFLQFVSFIDAYTKFSWVFWPLLAVCAFCASWFVIKSRLRIYLSRRSIFFAMTFISTVFLGFFYYVFVHHRICGVIRNCGPAPILRISELSVISVAAAQARQPAVIVSLDVDRTLSSFTIKQSEYDIHALHSKANRNAIEFNGLVHAAFRNAECTSGAQPIADAFPILQSILKSRNRHDLLVHVSSLKDYRNMITKGGQTFSSVLPTPAELEKLKQSKGDNSYNIVIKWLVECVGITDPVVVWTLKNNSSASLTLTGIEYNVLDIGQVKSGSSSVILLIDLPTHRLQYKTGKTRFGLAPGVTIGAGDTVQLRIKYELDAQDWGLSWLIRPTFLFLEGRQFTAPDFMVFAAKR